MNLVSCDNCGVVLDANKLDYDSTDPCDLTHMVWDKDRRGWVAFVPCPVCKTKIFSLN